MKAEGAFDDIVIGWYFIATMQRRTPAKVLCRHLEFWPKAKGPPPKIGFEGWEGIWMLAQENWMQFVATANMASDVGPVPADGGDYLPFLLALHGLSSHDAEVPYGSLRELIMATGKHGTPHAYYVERLGGILGCIGFGVVRSIFLVVWRYDYAEQLWAAGFRTIQNLLDATDHDLCTVCKLSKTGLQDLRRAARRSRLPLDAEYV